MILDTNALSAIADGDDSAIKAAAQAQRLAVPVVVLGEYRLGIAQSRHRETYQSWLREWVGAVAVLNIDEETTHSYGDIGLELKRKGQPIPTNDLWIAALCRQHSEPLLSRDKHFDLIPRLRRIDW